MADFNSSCSLSISPARVCTVCRLCLLRNKVEFLGGFEEMVEVQTNCAVPHRVYYCTPCYDYLCSRAGKEGTPFPPRDQHPWTGYVPLYIVKDNDPLKLFHPEDPIDLGRWRQQRQRQHEA